MELSDLTVFKAVAEEGGITKAAHKLHRVPSNVTARIQKLEQELNKDLFLREKNRLRISPAGEHLLDYAERILALAQEAMEALHVSEPRGRLRLGAIEMAAATRLVEPLMTFHQQYPDVELEVKTGPTGDLIDLLLAGELDMALVSDPPKDHRLEIKSVFKEELVFATDATSRNIKSSKDLSGSPTFLGFSTKCAYRTRLSEWLKHEEIIARVIEVNSYHAMLSCVTAGMGVGIIPQAVVNIYPYKQALRIHRLPVRWRRSFTCLTWRKDSDKPAMKAFTQCVNTFKEL